MSLQFECSEQAIKELIEAARDAIDCKKEFKQVAEDRDEHLKRQMIDRYSNAMARLELKLIYVEEKIRS